MNWLLSAVTFVVGIALGLLVRVGGRLELDPKVRVSDVVSIAVTLAIALFLKDYVDDRTSTRRAEKDLFINEFKSAMEVLQKVRETFSMTFAGTPLTATDKADIKRHLRSIANSFARIDRLATRTGLRLPAETIRKAKDLYFDYKVVVTGDDSVPRRPYALPLENQHENVFGALNEELAVAIHEINGC